MIAELRRHAFRFADLVPAYRYIVAFAAAQLLAATLLIVLRNAFRPSIWIGAPGRAAITPAAFGLSLLLLIVGLTYILYAAVFVHRWVRFGSLVCYSCLLAFPILLRQSNGMSLTIVFLLTATWALVYGLHARFKGMYGAIGRSQFHAAVLFAIFAFVAAAQILPLLGLGGLSYAASVLRLQFGALTIFVVPALLLAGVDLAQMSRVAAEWASSDLARRRVPSRLCTVALTGVLLLLAPRLLIFHSRLWILAQSTFFLALTALVVFLLWSSRATLPARRVRIKAAATAICALCIFGLSFVQAVGVAALQASRPIYVTEAFSIQYPSGWSRDAIDSSARPALVHTYAFSSRDGARLDVVRRDGSAPIDPLPNPPGADVRRVTWTIADGNVHWDLFGLAPARKFSGYAADFGSMRAAFRPGSGQANPYIAQSEAYVTLAGIVALTLIVIGLRKRISAVALFAVLAAIAWIFSHPAFFMVVLHMPESIVPVFDMYEVETFAAAASLSFMAWLWIRRRGAEDRAAVVLLALNMSLTFAGLLYALYGASMTASEEFSIAAALIIFIALAWDSAMSGELTNGHTATFPQPGRICLFFGYIILVVGVVLFFASVRFGAHANVIDPFQSELYPQKGLLLIGIPLMLTVFSLRFMHAVRKPVTQM
ncbi:MAG: hypothetical protein ACXWNZ_18175 [Vulcanimicrobiaceae bacterium]